MSDPTNYAEAVRASRQRIEECLIGCYGIKNPRAIRPFIDVARSFLQLGTSSDHIRSFTNALANLDIAPKQISATTEITLLDFADSVRAALIQFGHTSNITLVKPEDLHRIYEEACDAIAQEVSK